MSTSRIAEELETTIHSKISEINGRIISLLRVYEHLFSDPLLIVLPAFLSLRLKLFVTSMKVSHSYSGTILCYPHMC